MSNTKPKLRILYPESILLHIGGGRAGGVALPRGVQCVGGRAHTRQAARAHAQGRRSRRRSHSIGCVVQGDGLGFPSFDGLYALGTED